MAAKNSNTQPPRRFIRRPAVEAMVGLSCTEIYRRMAKGTFPRQIPLGPKSVAWDEAEVIAWCEARVAESRGEAA